MLKFSANISIMFTDLPVLKRIDAAAAAGFKAIEMWFPYEVPANTLGQALKNNDVVCVGINSPPGDVSAGDWGLAVRPDKMTEYLASIHQAMSYAQAIECPNIHVMAGVKSAVLSDKESWDVYVKNIGVACEIAQQYGRQVLIEPLNAVDRPTYILNRQAQAIEVIRALDLNNLKIMLDLYHVQRGEGNLTERLRQSLPYAGHIQIADVPGRHEPGTGEINFPFIFSEIERLGYEGWIGCEYAPLTSTDEGLVWLENAGLRLS